MKDYLADSSKFAVVFVPIAAFSSTAPVAAVAEEERAKTFSYVKREVSEPSNKREDGNKRERGTDLRKRENGNERGFGFVEE